MRQKSLLVKDEHDEQVQDLMRDPAILDHIVNERKANSTPGRAGESDVFRMALDIGIPQVAAILMRLSKN